MVVQSWDTAASENIRADYSVGTTWGYKDGVWWLIDLVRVRLEFGDLLARIRFEQAKHLPEDILIENAFCGRGILDTLFREYRRGDIHFRPVAYEPQGSKLVRFLTHVELLHNGRFLFPKYAPWLSDLRRELMAFPNGKNDDQVDSFSQFAEIYGHYDPLPPRRLRQRTR